MKTSITCVLALSLSVMVFSGCNNKETKSPTQAELCEQTILDYARLRDEVDQAEAYGELFTENGIFELGPNVIKGQDALKDRHKAANKDTTFNHVMDDISINGKTGKSRVVVYTQDRNGSEDITRVIIADYDDKFELQDGKCLISERKVNVLFDTALPN